MYALVQIQLSHFTSEDVLDMVCTLQEIGIHVKLFIITDYDQFCRGQYYSICADVKTKCVIVLCH